MLRHARFIVFEGLDGAGTTTQAARLHDLFTRRGTPSFLTREPTPAPVGTFIRRVLTAKERAPDGAPYHPGERVMGLLFAADRLGHAPLIHARRRAGEHVVCDRYVFSSMAYQTLDPEIDAEWVIGVNAGCVVPDITLFLAAPVDVCLARVSSRRSEAAMYENRAHLEAIAANYEKLMTLYEQHFGRVVRIDGTMAAEDVHAAVVGALGAG